MKDRGWRLLDDGWRLMIHGLRRLLAMYDGAMWMSIGTVVLRMTMMTSVLAAEVVITLTTDVDDDGDGYGDRYEGG